jgi:hypothetical protein
MTFGLELEDPSADSIAPYNVPRTVPAVKMPPAAGWRLDAFERPHLRNQLLRRYSRLNEFRDWFERAANQRDLVRKREQQKLRRDFLRLSAQWKRDTEFISSVTDMVTHPAYLRIIGMGADVLPLLLAELQNAPDHWFCALEAITQTNPVPSEDRGKVKEMVEHWIKWARRQKIVL